MFHFVHTWCSKIFFLLLSPPWHSKSESASIWKGIQTTGNDGPTFAEHKLGARKRRDQTATKLRFLTVIDEVHAKAALLVEK